MGKVFGAIAAVIGLLLLLFSGHGLIGVIVIIVGCLIFAASRKKTVPQGTAGQGPTTPAPPPAATA